MTTFSVSLRSMGFQAYFHHTGDFGKKHTKFLPLQENLRLLFFKTSIKIV
jgi:hypothetical protein